MFDGDGLSSRVIVRVVAIIVALSLLVCFPRHIRFLQTQVDAQTQNVAWDAAASTQARREAMVAAVLTGPEREELHRLLRLLMRAFPDHVHGRAHKAHASEASED